MLCVFEHPIHQPAETVRRGLSQALVQYSYYPIGNCNDLAYEQFELHRKAFDGLNAPFSEFLGSVCADGQKRPDWIIVDSYHHWAAAAAIKNQVPCAMLVLSSASIISRPSEQGPTSAAPKFEMESKKSFYEEDASGMSMAKRCYLTIESCSIIAIRSCLEWEPEFIPLAATFRGKPVIPFGLLPPSPEGGRGVCKDATVLRWLDAQPSRSVLCVAMGSEVPLSMEQVHELALGLELAGTRFLWALRKPNGVADSDLLPTGFVNRTHGQGLVIMGWIPQITVLEPHAVYAFLTHCGWNSTIEGLLFAHPLVMLPIRNDQRLIARLMEGRKVGVQVARNEDDGSFDREGIRAAVQSVMVGKEGSGSMFAANAKKLQEIVADKKLHESYLDGFIQQLRSIAVVEQV
ncbi:UDP-glycosyltransferase 91D2-like [Triticum dicoccoides]|uniref:UDP-glycosyltransferase 91D2-like n=1 Tax=Triticum dicoccoides TaxID=85692 RepID=UPI00188DE672|nr:UDP-glycosyltransferase 91D2-like [Triticum dicoccoides]